MSTYIQQRGVVLALSVAASIAAGARCAPYLPKPMRVPTDAAATDSSTLDGRAPIADAGFIPTDASAPPIDARFDVPLVDAPTLHPDVQGVSRAGGMCSGSFACAPLIECDLRVVNGFCTGPCTNSSSQLVEQAQCGGSNATCLTAGEGASARSRCTNACSAFGGDSGLSCRHGTICTGHAFTRGSLEPDTPGCAPFCRDDLHCPAGTRCNRRTGECGAGEDPTRLENGQLCEIPSPGAPSPCKGFCYHRPGTDPRLGVCASLVDVRAGAPCADSGYPILPIIRSGEALALCAFEQCTPGICCAPGLVCESLDGFARCVVDNPAIPDQPCSRLLYDGAIADGARPLTDVQDATGDGPDAGPADGPTDASDDALAHTDSEVDLDARNP